MATDIVPEIECRIQQGQTLKTIAVAVGLSKSQVHRIAVAHNLSRREWPRLSVDQKELMNRLIDRDSLSLVAIARAVGCSYRTVWMARQTKHDARSPTRNTVARRCHCCGHLIVVQPCLVCTAREYVDAA